MLQQIFHVRGDSNGRPGGLVDDAEVLPAFRQASWDEALALVAARLGAIKQQHGPGALAGFGSAKCSNEEAYLFQKLMRAVLGTICVSPMACAFDCARGSNELSWRMIASTSSGSTAYAAACSATRSPHAAG